MNKKMIHVFIFGFLLSSTFILPSFADSEFKI